MPGLSAYDFGDSIRFGANDCAEDEPDQSKVHFSLHLYEVFAKGYLEAAGKSMDEADRRSLAWGAKLMTLECGIRFLTDYLEGDHYFKTSRPGQNLDRARTQFTLVKGMDSMRCLPRAIWKQPASLWTRPIAAAWHGAPSL